MRQAVCCGDITEAVHGDAGGEAQDPAPADADLGDEHRDVGGIRTSEHHTRSGWCHGHVGGVIHHPGRVLVVLGGALHPGLGAHLRLRDLASASGHLPSHRG